MDNLKVLAPGSRQQQLLLWAGFSGLGVALLVASSGKLYSEPGTAGWESP